MITGAFQVEAAVLVLDITKDYDEIRTAPKDKAITQEILQVENGSIFIGMYTAEVRTDAYLGAAKFGFAKRNYRQKRGKFVDSLNQPTSEIILYLLLDLFTGKDYIYWKKDKGFIVCSVGDNSKDDGGIL